MIPNITEATVSREVITIITIKYFDHSISLAILILKLTRLYKPNSDYYRKQRRKLLSKKPIAIQAIKIPSAFVPQSSFEAVAKMK